MGVDKTSYIASLSLMAYRSKLQVIRRGSQNRQYYLICPAPLAAALELEKGESLEWVIRDRHTLEIRRLKGTPRSGRSRHE
jgi:bifunctional DNA-binding transcriptional regulator/antitoxin component of YhaV-PrlF toxin-antitoxin module